MINQKKHGEEKDGSWENGDLSISYLSPAPVVIFKNMGKKKQLPFVFDANVDVVAFENKDYIIIRKEGQTYGTAMVPYQLAVIGASSLAQSLLDSVKKQKDRKVILEKLFSHLIFARNMVAKLDDNELALPDNPVDNLILLDK